MTKEKIKEYQDYIKTRTANINFVINHLSESNNEAVINQLFNAIEDLTQCVNFMWCVEYNSKLLQKEMEQ